MSWIRFGEAEAGLDNLLKGVETFSKEESKVKGFF